MIKTLEAASVLIGTMIGAGILGIPYVIMKSGFMIGMIHILFIGALVLLIDLYIGEITLRTHGFHQLSGYAQIYLGNKGKFLMMLSFVFGIYSALLAYIIGEGRSLSYLIFGNPQYEFILGLAFWIILSAIAYKGISALKKGEPIGIVFIFVMIISIVVLFWNKIDITNFQHINTLNALFPFGLILFAFLGFSAIPEVERILGKDRKRMKRTIFISVLIAALIYTIFTIVVLGVNGSAVPEIATISLGKPFILLGMITMFGAYLALSIANMDMLKIDYENSKVKSWILTVSVPLLVYLVLYLTNNLEFTTILGIGGVISGGLTAILILMMVSKAKKYGKRTPEYNIPYSNILKWILIAIFIAGAAAEIIYSI